MARASASSPQTSAESHGRAARARQWLRRATGSAGYERHTAMLVLKSALAASISWEIAHDVMHAQSPAFAPFSAVLIMQVSLYQSLWQTLRYAGAVALGVALQGLLGLLVNPDWLTFVLVALIATVIGRWRPLGAQGPQVATAAFFAFSVYVSAPGTTEKLTQLGQIIVLVLIGCVVGGAVNVLVMPPMRYRSAEHGIHVLAQSLCDLVSDICPVLRENSLDEEQTRQWRQRAAQMGSLVAQAQTSVETSRESTYYNPRRLLQRHGKATFAGYGAVIDSLERVTYQLASMTRTFDQVHAQEEAPFEETFLPRYGDFLASLAPVTRLLSQLDEDRIGEISRELCSAAEEARKSRTRLAPGDEDSALSLGDPSSLHGVLVIEAVRLMGEFQHTCDILQQTVSDSPDH